MAVGTKQLSSLQAIGDIEADLRALDVKNVDKANQGRALHEIYNKDVFFEEAIKAPEKEALRPSFSSKLQPWWLEPQKMTSVNTGKATLDAAAIERAAPIGAIPAIEKPELEPNADLSLEMAVPKVQSAIRKKLEASKTEPALEKSVSKKIADPTIENSPKVDSTEEPAAKPLSSDEMMEIIAKVSPRTMHEIMSIVLKAQLEIETEGANLSNDCFTKLINVRKLQERTLDDIKKALEKDENISGWMKAGQTVALVAGAIAGIAAIAVTAGASAPVVVALGTVGPYVSAGFAALVAGGTGYANYRTNEDKAKLAEFQHIRKKSDDLIEDYRERIGSIAETDSHFKEKLIQILKHLEKMKNMVALR
ncbi:hypothetical protein [Candidatus Protochlamydia phocaeensis]|uniref:hypothetical protein n=1 Tax=Candidatus Protochlamydia phocaeensis TaxID=1414722 RepID=UPI000838145A|nr:hypothetical protein [Candidatus Protochlamydia phocaeensis]